jgi:hypothetical protein
VARLAAVSPHRECGGFSICGGGRGVAGDDLGNPDNAIPKRGRREGRARLPWRRDPVILARLVEVERRNLIGERNTAIALALKVDEPSWPPIAQPRARVAVKPCHSSGKTFTAAEIVLWWVERGGIASPPRRRGRRSSACSGARSHHAGAQGRAASARRHAAEQTEYQVGAERLRDRPLDQRGRRFQGFHGKVLIVLDEAPGVRPDIFEAIEGIRAGGDVRVLMLGNPTIASGPFYDAFGRERRTWQTFTIDAFATPNLAGVGIEDLRAIPLDENDTTRCSTRTRAPTSRRAAGSTRSCTPGARTRRCGSRACAANSRCSRRTRCSRSPGWRRRDGARFPRPTDADEWEAGIDVAGPGEAETSLTPSGAARRWSRRASWAKADPRGEVLAALAPLKDRWGASRWTRIGQGYYFARHLEDAATRAGRGCQRRRGGERPEKYANYKAELYWALRMRLRRATSPGWRTRRRWGNWPASATGTTPGARGHRVKDEARKRGVPSPDRAEAIMLCYAPARPLKRVEAW